ncbi:hypothetical protein EON82_22215 [bacterium]|nr:MAG: hypothetical protein EON82_22215 [bacterium]
MGLNNAGILIPVVAIIGGLCVGATAIVMDYKRRKLVSEERRAMIEKGMEPPPLDESAYGYRDPVKAGESSLQRGISSVMLGLGLAVAAWLLHDVITDTFIPRGIVGPLAIGACVLVFLGIGNLVFYAVSRKDTEVPRG